MNILKDSALENVTKDIGEIACRLLDHRAVVHGEIKYFIKEFEIKRSDREVKRLNADLEKLKEINEKIGPECVELMSEHLPSLKDHLAAANKICANLQSHEEKHMELRVLDSLQEQRQQRDEKWSYFLEELSKERDREDVEHAREMQAIDDHFAKLVETLSTSSS